MKKRSKSQQIGMLAEAEFEGLGLRAGLLPEKVRKDFGVDYLCQVEGRAGEAGAVPVSGGVIGAAVRGTDGRKAKIRLSRKDVLQLLSTDFPICLVLVHSPSSTKPQLFFRFVDEVFSGRLADSLRGGARSMTVRSNDLLGWSSFPGELARVTAPGFVERVRLSRAARAVNEILPRSRLAVQRTERGELTVVAVADFFGQFAIESAEEMRLVHAAAFGAASRLTERFAQLRVNPRLIDALRDLPSPIVIAAPVLEEVITVDGPSGHAGCTFERRHTTDHFGWVHASGFSITISVAVQEGDRWVHIVSAQPDPVLEVELGAFPDLWQFLERCVRGADVRFPAGKLVLKADDVGALPRYAYFARHLRSAAKLHPWPSGTWGLSGAGADDTLHTLAWLSALEEKIPTIEGWGMVVGDVRDDELQADPGAFVVPVCANLPHGGLVTWLTVEGHRLVARGGVAGFRILAIRDVVVEQREQRFAKSVWPELVLHAELPPLLIPEMRVSSSDARGWGCGVLLEAGDGSEEEPGENEQGGTDVLKQLDG